MRRPPRHPGRFLLEIVEHGDTDRLPAPLRLAEERAVGLLVDAGDVDLAPVVPPAADPQEREGQVAFRSELEIGNAEPSVRRLRLSLPGIIRFPWATAARMAR